MKKLYPLLALLLLVAFCYLIYKTWDIFGFWNIILTGIFSLFTGILLSRFARARKEVGDEVIYNPKEFPKIAQIAVSIGICYYLFTVVSSKNISSYEYTFGLIYIFLLTGLPIVISFIKIIRDRNDFVSVSDTVVRYKDNSDTGEIKIDQIQTCSYSKKGMLIELKDGSSRLIELQNMNFSSVDIFSLVNEIDKYLPKTSETADESTEKNETI
jgi:hypothetical protein